MAYPKRTPEKAARDFERLTTPEPNTGCLLWLGRMRSQRGYAAWKVDGKTVSLTRYLLGRAPGDPRYACHKCNNPGCVNIEHLYAGSHADNSRDTARSGVLKGRGNPRAVLDEEKVRDIRRLRGAGTTLNTLCREFGIGMGTLTSLLSGRNWSWVE
jgi:hypothetical protein